MTRGPVRLDLHVHSRRSPDSWLSLERIFERMSLAGIQGFALTDHNTIAGHAELAALARAHPAYLFVPGVEVSTHEGHLLVYGARELPPIHRPLAETLDWTRARGLPASLAHPFRRTHGVGERAARAHPAEAIETVNAHNGELANARAAYLASELRLGETGGSDAHALSDVGRAYTEFPDGDGGIEPLLRALSHGHTDAGGGSAPTSARVGNALRSALLRVGRGFRAI